MAILIITTKKDHSFDELRLAAESYGIEVIRVDYTDSLEMIKQIINKKDLSAIYFRDPFNTAEYDEAQIKQVIDIVKKSNPSATYIDNIENYHDIAIEDKWLQYQKLGKYMPTTNTLSATGRFNEGEHIAKQRISSRGRGIAFNRDQIDRSQDYIIQPLLDIKKEYRIFGINGKIVERGAVRTAKTTSSKVKMQKAEKIPIDVLEFARGIYKLIPRLDFVGFDIAVLSDGSKILIEINRSPQFKRYNQITNDNLADDLMKGLS